jgi:lysophospholipase L1-like esterase
LVCDWLSKTYDADVTRLNKAQGGWTTKQGMDNFIGGENRVGPYLEEIDLLIIAFGANDPRISDEVYRSQIKAMMDMYLEVNPDGNILLVSPFVFNQQTTNWYINQYRFEGLLEQNKAEYATSGKCSNVSVAKVYSFFKGVCDTGKRSRDYLGNNINHPNDFGVRIYAQVVLKTLCGEEFFPLAK